MKGVARSLSLTDARAGQIGIGSPNEVSIPVQQRPFAIPERGTIRRLGYIVKALSRRSMSVVGVDNP